MINFFKKIALKLGFDKAIIFTSSANLISSVGSIVSIFLVIKYLTAVEQGFYYTFGSLVAIQIFFELGLNGIITQYVAHEKSNLRWKTKDLLIGDSKHKSRLSSLLHFCIKWYVISAIILFIFLFFLGLFFFNTFNSTNGNIIWVTPWVLISLATSIDLIISPFIAFLQGLGKVKEMARILLFKTVFKLVIIWIGLMLGAKLFVLGLATIIGLIVVLIFLIYGNYHKLIFNIWNINIIEKVSYRNEIFPFQWKIALSWISGYFIFQLFNPVLFAVSGPEVAGQMGITLAALNGILSLSVAWISTKIPLFSGLIAQKNYFKLDNIFNKTLKQSLLINFSALVTFIFLIFLVREFNIKLGDVFVGDKFLSYLPLIFMAITVFLNQFVNSWATYLRCHKKEPYLLTSVIGGILSSLSTIILGKYFGVLGVTTGYLIISLALFPWVYSIYKTKKIKWHN